MEEGFFLPCHARGGCAILALEQQRWFRIGSPAVSFSIQASWEGVLILGKDCAPGKVILFGEHAVVYGRPALAVPVTQVVAEATVAIGDPGSGLSLHAIDLDETVHIKDAPADHPLATAARLALAHLGLADPDWRLTLRSTIPIASGMGSGAAVSAAIVRALSEAANQRMPDETVSELVYQVDRLHHGTPSGIDNTVIAYGRPVYFVSGRPPQPFPIPCPFHLAIADTGIASPTRHTVGDVRRAWQRQPDRLERVFDQIAEIVEKARILLAGGNSEQLGPLMDANHALLQRLDVSSPVLDALASAAQAAGAGGAKLSGAGRGGNLIALVTRETADAVVVALRSAGAANVLVTEVGGETGANPSVVARLALPNKKR